MLLLGTVAATAARQGEELGGLGKISAAAAAARPLRSSRAANGVRLSESVCDSASGARQSEWIAVTG